MKAHLTDAAYEVLDPGSYPIGGEVLGVLPVARLLYGMITLALEPLLVHWLCAGIEARRCSPCASIPCQIQEGSQS